MTFLANFIVAVMAPVLGTIADAGGYRKRFLVIFALVGAVMTAALGFVDEGRWGWALTFYVFASIGFYSSTVFYDSLLVGLAESRKTDVVSALGYALGYLGGSSESAAAESAGRVAPTERERDPRLVAWCGASRVRNSPISSAEVEGC